MWLHGDVRTPPFSRSGRLEAGLLLRKLQEGESLGLPHTRLMPAIGSRCHELRIRDEGHNWRLFYRLDSAAVLILDVLDACRARAERYNRDATGERR